MGLKYQGIIRYLRREQIGEQQRFICVDHFFAGNEKPMYDALRNNKRICRGMEFVGAVWCNEPSRQVDLECRLSAKIITRDLHNIRLR